MRDRILRGISCAAPAAILVSSLAASASPPGIAMRDAAGPPTGGIDLDRVAGPMGGGDTVDLEPVPERASPRATRRVVYTCVAPGLVTFSDRPCGPLPGIRELKLDASEPRAGRAASTTPLEPAASARKAPRDDARDARNGRSTESPAAEPGRSPAEMREATCRRLAEAVQSLDQHMRSGYSAREAARLWARWREARERLREADC
jgi:hypothetical protein